MPHATPRGDVIQWLAAQVRVILKRINSLEQQVSAEKDPTGGIVAPVQDSRPPVEELSGGTTVLPVQEPGVWSPAEFRADATKSARRKARRKREIGQHAAATPHAAVAGTAPAETSTEGLVEHPVASLVHLGPGFLSPFDLGRLAPLTIKLTI